MPSGPKLGRNLGPEVKTHYSQHFITIHVGLLCVVLCSVYLPRSPSSNLVQSTSHQGSVSALSRDIVMFMARYWCYSRLVFCAGAL